MIDFNVIFSFALAFFVAYAAMPLVRVFAFKVNAVDVPKDARRMHKKPIPLLGGLAIYLGFIVASACFVDTIESELFGVLLGSLVVVVTGALDDRFDITPIVKLGAQIIAAGVAIAYGVQVRIFSQPIMISGVYRDLSFLNIPFTFIWIILVTNAINLIDGLDGLAVSVSGISATALLFLCLIEGRTALAVPLAAVVGGCLGFLPYNMHPAKIFMGDSGALFLGYILSTVSVMGFFRTYSVMSYIVPVIVMGVPVFDTSFTIIRRMISRKGIMHADRGHLHHRLIDMGFNQKETVSLLGILTALLSILTIILVTKGIMRALVVAVVLALFVVSVQMYKKNKSVSDEYLKAIEAAEEEKHSYEDYERSDK